MELIFSVNGHDVVIHAMANDIARVKATDVGRVLGLLPRNTRRRLQWLSTDFPHAACCVTARVPSRGGYQKTLMVDSSGVSYLAGVVQSEGGKEADVNAAEVLANVVSCMDGFIREMNELRWFCQALDGDEAALKKLAKNS